DKGVALTIISLVEDVAANPLANSFPMLARPVETVLLDRFDRTIEGDPAHNFREGELPRFPAYFPYPAIRAVPDFFEVFEQFFLQKPGNRALFEPVAMAGVQRVHQLTEYIELQLFVGGVADAHRTAVLVAGEPRQLVFGQAAFAGDAVHDLHFRR